jgi:hypothetical protein
LDETIVFLYDEIRSNDNIESPAKLPNLVSRGALCNRLRL